MTVANTVKYHIYRSTDAVGCDSGFLIFQCSVVWQSLAQLMVRPLLFVYQ